MSSSSLSSHLDSPLRLKEMQHRTKSFPQNLLRGTLDTVESFPHYAVSVSGLIL